MRNNNDNRRRPRIVLFLFVLILSSATSFAHPMGNFSVNHYSKITVKRESIEIRYLIDMAEIPTFQEIRQFDITPKVDDPSASRYLDRQEQLLKAGISLESDDQSVRLDTISRHVAFADGAGGLPTMKIGFVFRGKLDVTAGAHKLSYFDNNFPGRAGWKEVVVLGDGITLLSSSAPGTDRSQELTNYSSDVLNSPPQQLSALVVLRTSLSEPERTVAAAVIATSSNRTTPRGTNAAHQASAPPPPRQRQRQSSGVITSGAITRGATTSPDLSDAQSSTSGIAASVALLPLAARAQNTPHSRFTELISHGLCQERDIFPCSAWQYCPPLSSIFVICIHGGAGCGNNSIGCRIRSDLARSPLPRSSLPWFSPQRQTGSVRDRNFAGIVSGNASFHRSRPRRGCLHHCKPPKIHQKLGGYWVALGIGTHPDHFSGRIRNYHLRCRDPAPPWTVHGVLRCLDAYSAGHIESNRRYRLAYRAPYSDEKGRRNVTNSRFRRSYLRGPW